ncbi:TPA: DUF1366 domain-containing protein [Streptococcus suis]
MALQVRTKYQAGKIVRYVVQQDEPFLRYESGFEGNLSAFTDEDIIAFALEELYNTLFPNRAENEKFNTIGERIAKFDAMIDEATKTIGKMEEQVSLSVASRSAFLKVVMALYQKGLLSDEELVETGLFDDEDVE